jgi:hypothetical protein
MRSRPTCCSAAVAAGRTAFSRACFYCWSRSSDSVRHEFARPERRASRCRSRARGAVGPSP